MGNNKKKEKIDFKYNLKVYFGFLKKYKLVFIVLLVMSLVLEALGLVNNYLFKALVDNGADFASHKLNYADFIHILIIIVVVYVSVVLATIFLKWLNIHLINRFEANVVKDLKSRFFNHIVNLSYEFHTTHRAGSLIARLTRGGKAIEGMSDIILFNFAPMIFQLFVAVGAMIYFDIIPGLIIFIVFIVFISYNLFINMIQESSNVRAVSQEDFEKANISDVFTNIESIKYFGKESLIKKRLLKIFQKTSEAFCKNWDYYRFLSAGESLITAIGTFLIIYFPLQKFLQDELTLGTLVFIYTIYVRVIDSAHGFVYGLRGYYRAMADFQSLFEYGKIENEIKDIPGARRLRIRDGRVDFKNVTFGYKGHTILKNFNLSIPKNKKIALVGPSGAGKTTIIKLLYRLYDVENGEVLIDGKDVRSFTQESLRSELSIVPQECVLFDDTIYNNIRFSKPDATRREVMRVIKLAKLDRIIKDFPQKENTIVGERGIKLSGGEKQRVSIARAILANKKILILDEATSSLDSETEHDIQEALSNLMKNRTTIIIAHRLSTIMSADKIVVLDKGRIVQQGTHKELIKQRGLYKKLWSLQRGGYIK